MIQPHTGSMVEQTWKIQGWALKTIEVTSNIANTLLDFSANEDQNATYFKKAMIAPLIYIYMHTDSLVILGHINSTILNETDEAVLH